MPLLPLCLSHLPTFLRHGRQTASAASAEANGRRVTVCEALEAAHAALVDVCASVAAPLRDAELRASTARLQEEATDRESAALTARSEVATSEILIVAGEGWAAERLALCAALDQEEAGTTREASSAQHVESVVETLHRELSERTAEAAAAEQKCERHRTGIGTHMGVYRMLRTGIGLSHATHGPAPMLDPLAPRLPWHPLTSAALVPCPQVRASRERAGEAVRGKRSEAGGAG